MRMKLACPTSVIGGKADMADLSLCPLVTLADIHANRSRLSLRGTRGAARLEMQLASNALYDEPDPTLAVSSNSPPEIAVRLVSRFGEPRYEALNSINSSLCVGYG